MLAVSVGRGVLEGVKVMVGGNVFVGGAMKGVLPDGGMYMAVKVGRDVGVWVLNRMLVGVLEGVAVSAENPLGRADPRIGKEIRNVRALAETILIGSIGKIEMIGS